MTSIIELLLSQISEDRLDSLSGTLSRNIPESLIPDIVRKPYRRHRANTRIDALDIVGSGSGDPYPYIKVAGGATFYGFPSQEKHLKFYEQLDDEYKDVLVPEAYFVAEQCYLSFERGHFNREEQYTIQPGDTVADIGAHHGYYAYQLAEKVEEDGDVIAFEAHPDNYEVLKKNIEANGLDNVTAVNKAVAEETGTITFYERETYSGKHHTVTAEKYPGTPSEEYSGLDVECGTLDSILDSLGVSSIDFATLTVNKAEYEVLKGMQDALDDGVAVAVVGSAKVDDIYSLLHSHGYETMEADEYYVSPIIYGMPSE